MCVRSRRVLNPVRVNDVSIKLSAAPSRRPSHEDQTTFRGRKTVVRAWHPFDAWRVAYGALQTI